MQAPGNSEMLKTKDAAIYLGISESSLSQGRMNGRRKTYISPPPFHRYGKTVRYRKADLDEWLRKHRVDLSENVPNE